MKKSEVTALSEDIRKAIDGQAIEFRDNKEGAFSLLKNDIHTFVSLKEEQTKIATKEHALLSEYVSSISHQLKTPLTSVQIMMDLLEDAPPEKQAEFIYQMKKSLAHMDWLTTTLLKMARLDANMVEFSSAPIEVRELLNLALEPLDILLDVNNQVVSLAHNITITCDKRWTCEALTNLLKNAIEHAKKDSTIVVDCGENPLYHWVSIVDTGKGLDRKEIASLWTRFASAQHKKGHGIGLPLALSIVRSQNGDIDVDGGGNGIGATFTLKFFHKNDNIVI